MMRIVLATVWCILGSWSLVIKPNFCSDFEHKVCSRFWCWSSGKIFKLEFGQYFAADVLQRLRSWILIEMLKLGLVNILNFKFSRDGDVWLRFWSKCLVEILKMKFDQDLCLNLWYDPIGYFGKMNSTLGSVCAFGNVYLWKVLEFIMHFISFYVTFVSATPHFWHSHIFSAPTRVKILLCSSNFSAVYCHLAA